MSRRALVVEQPGALALVDRDDLVPGLGEVLVRPSFCGVCGSDLELLRGQVDAAFVRYPLTLGHEWSGTIEAVGPGVEGVVPGQRCVGEGIIPCGRCAPCRAGATNVCLTYDEIGFTREGAASDQLLIPALRVHPLGDGVSLLDAALTEPSAVVLTGLLKARPLPGQRVLVVGDGTIGLLATLLAALWSPAELAMVGRRDEQRELAHSVGATSFELADPPADAGYDLVIEATGVAEAIPVAVRAARRGGTVLLLGLPPTGTTFELPADLLVNNDLTVTASFGYTTAAWSSFVGLLAAGAVTPGKIVTHRYPLAEYDAAFAELSSPTGARGKILLEVADG
jgi:L-iditol 2-dehydrogenase